MSGMVLYPKTKRYLKKLSDFEKLFTKDVERRLYKRLDEFKVRSPTGAVSDYVTLLRFRLQDITPSVVEGLLHDDKYGTVHGFIDVTRSMDHLVHVSDHIMMIRDELIELSFNLEILSATCRRVICKLGAIQRATQGSIP